LASTNSLVIVIFLVVVEDSGGHCGRETTLTA